jgi:hypothetical protein
MHENDHENYSDKIKRIISGIHGVDVGIGEG